MCCFLKTYEVLESEELMRASKKCNHESDIESYNSDSSWSVDYDRIGALDYVPKKINNKSQWADSILLGLIITNNHMNLILNQILIIR